MNIKLLTEHHLEFLSLKGGCTGLSESNFCQNATLLEITSYVSSSNSFKKTHVHVPWKFCSISACTSRIFTAWEITGVFASDYGNSVWFYIHAKTSLSQTESIDVRLLFLMCTNFNHLPKHALVAIPWVRCSMLENHTGKAAIKNTLNNWRTWIKKSGDKWQSKTLFLAIFFIYVRW